MLPLSLKDKIKITFSKNLFAIKAEQSNTNVHFHDTSTGSYILSSLSSGSPLKTYIGPCIF